MRTSNSIKNLTMEEENSLISVIIPIYNVEKYLNKCIESIVNQTYKNIEIILVDDGSTDSCSKICDEWLKKDKRIKVIHKKNKGVSAARNTGIDKAIGNYIVFVDSDDFLEKDAIKVMIKNIDKHDIVICNNYNIYDNLKKENLYKKNELGIFNLEKLINQFFNNYNSFVLNVPWNKIYKKSIIEKNKLRFREDTNLGEDFIFNIDYFVNCNDIFITNDIIYNYRVSNEGLARKKREIQFYWDNEKKNNLHLISELKKKDVFYHNEESITHFIISRLKYTFYIICNLKDYDKKTKQKEIKRICKSINDFSIKINKIGSLKEKVWIIIMRLGCTNIIYKKFKERKSE